MRVLDINNIEITSPDLSKGRLVDEQIVIASHPAIEEVAEQWHYETIATYPNGGKDVQKVIDVPGIKAEEAWDEYETIKRYILYTQEELDNIEKERNKPTQFDRIEAQVLYTALMTDTLIEEA